MTRFGWLSILTLLTLVAIAPLPAAAADCPVQIRLWVQDGDAWFDHGETVKIPLTERRPRLGIYLGTGNRPQQAQAEWGYPKDFGFDSARPKEVAEHLHFVKQNRQDIENGRLRFTNQAAGVTYLGYRVVGAADPAAFDGLDEVCRSGEVKIEIVDPAASEEEAAEPIERATALCQEAVREKMTALSGAEIEFTAADSEELSESELRITVDGELIVRERRQNVSYGCLVDLDASEVTGIEFLTPRQ